MIASDGVAIPQWMGRSVPRVEDPRLLTGKGRYVADHPVPGALHAFFVRSDVAHGRIVSIDTSSVARREVVAIVTGEQLAREGIELHGSFDAAMPPLAVGTVHYVGQPVVAIVATDRYAAEDAADQVLVEYDPLPSVTTAEGAKSNDVLVHPELGSNLLSHAESWPDLDDVFRAADLVVAGTFRTQLQTAMPLETRGLLASSDPGTQTLEVIASTQMPHIYRELVADIFGLAQSKVRVLAPDVGGAFGIKLALYPEDVVVIRCAIRLGRPVAWYSDRREALLSDCQARGATYEAEAAFARDGTWLGLRVDMTFPGGAYAAVPYSGGVAELFVGSVMLPGPYKVQHYGYRGDVVFTNTPPTTTYRATGGPGAVWVTESLLDQAAERLGIDRVELRRQNLVKNDEFPFQSVSGAELDPGSYVECLDEAVRLSG
jgi:carbon-monoxide dehydrogenase large subunit